MLANQSASAYNYLAVTLSNVSICLTLNNYKICSLKPLKPSKLSKQERNNKSSASNFKKAATELHVIMNNNLLWLIHVKTTASCCSKESNFLPVFSILKQKTLNKGDSSELLRVFFAPEVLLFEKSTEPNCHVDVRHQESQWQCCAIEVWQ